MTEDTRATQELDRLPLRAILVVAAVTIAVFAVSVIAAAEAARTATDTRVPAPRDTLERSLVENTARGVELQRRRAHDLDRWTWIDRDAGIAQMPIDEAIDLTVEAER